MGQNGELLCSFSTNHDEFWVSLIEKAYIKVSRYSVYDICAINLKLEKLPFIIWLLLVIYGGMLLPLIIDNRLIITITTMVSQQLCYPNYHTALVFRMHSCDVYLNRNFSHTNSHCET